MGFGGWLFAAMYDRMLARTEKAGLRAFRARLLESAQGRVLEIGAGTGANLPLYGPRVEMLCTVVDPLRALREVWRVLKPGGQFLFIEHVRSDEPRLAKWQDRLNGLNRIVAHGCSCNRSTVDAILQSGFTIRSLEKTVLPKAPPFVRPLVIGTAIKAGP